MPYRPSRKLRARIVALTVAFAFALSWLPPSAAVPQLKVTWSQGVVAVEVPAGSQSTRQLTLTATQALGNINIEPVSAIAGLVSPSPAFLPSVAANTPQPVTLTFAPPVDAALGRYDGTIHVRSGSRTIPQTLKVSITVTKAELPDENEDEMNSPREVTLAGVSETAFNPLSATVRFQLNEATYGADPEDVHLFKNKLPVSAALVQLTPGEVAVSSVLSEGRNDLLLVAKDSQGLTVFKEVTLWAGNLTLFGSILDENNLPATGTVLTAQLGDDKAVQAVATGVNGQFSFNNLPGRTIIIEAVDTNNRLASIATNGAEGFVQLKLSSIGPPSPIDNNDFSLGTDGWNIGTAPVQIVPHDEGSETLQSFGNALQASWKKAPFADRAARAAAFKSAPFVRQGEAAASKETEVISLALADSDMDLVLNTAGEGPQQISRTFQIEEGTENVTVRYRFITSEVPGGYFGTQFNDYFNVSIRSQGAGGAVSESQSMNGLGLAAFDAAGATSWRETALSVDTEGDTLQVDLTVANVADGLFDSQLVIDVVKEKKLAITKLSLKDIDNTSLGHLSTASHTYFSGNTRIHGTVTVEGAEDDSLESLVLEVIQNGGVVATADLSSGANSALIKAFGTAKKVEITTSQLLFNLTSAQAAAVNGAEDGTLSLRARAKSVNGEEVTKDAGSVQLLVRFTGASRYGGRDGNLGGDDWVKPSMKEIADHFAVTYGDFSNMNGGPFAPHSSHRTGNDLDGWFSGYNARNAATAATVISHLNDDSYGSRISAVFVTFDRTATNLFWNAIKDVTLDDGRRARDVIVPVGGHTTHFHWRN